MRSSFCLQRASCLVNCFSGYPALLMATSFPTSHSLIPLACQSQLMRFAVRHSHGAYRNISQRTFPVQSTKDGGDDDTRDKKECPVEQVLSRSPPEDHKILRKTLQWLQNVVIGLNLCPFAERPFKTQNMNFEVVRGVDEDEVLRAVLGECLVRQTRPGTSLLICPDLYPDDFESYLEINNVLNEGVLIDHELDVDVQIAPFHPLFEFDGSGSDGVDNYTNRSPYPIFHVLREEEVEKAVDLLDGDAGKVWRRNVALLEELGNILDDKQLDALMCGDTSDEDTNGKVATILRNLRTKEF